MADTRDPVCGMTVNPASAPARATMSGETYYFCSERCRSEFESAPGKWARASSDIPRVAEGRGEKLEAHEPPFTKSGGITAPKFGAAGSGGAEYERLPERHDREPDERDR